MPDPADVLGTDPSPSTAPAGRLGRILAGRYRVEALLGEGGMGEVYRARHLLLDKPVALKVLVDGRAVPRAAERFFREARATAAIGHPGIVDITDFGETDDGAVFIAMEFLEGEDLSATILREKRLPWDRASAIVAQVCAALQAAHEHGIVHRDLKPENCFRITRDGNPDYIKVLDFGIAKLLRHDAGRRLTRTGAIFGTVEYMAPEQARGKEVDHRADVYSLGVILYEMLTGRLPFEGDEWMAIALKHVSEPLVSPSAIVGQGVLPPGADALLQRALAKDPAERFPTMEAFARALHAVDRAPAMDAADALERTAPAAEQSHVRAARATVELKTPVRPRPQTTTHASPEDPSVAEPSERDARPRSTAAMRVAIAVLVGLCIAAAAWVATRPSAPAATPDPGPTRVIASAPPPPGDEADTPATAQIETSPETSPEAPPATSDTPAPATAVPERDDEGELARGRPLPGLSRAQITQTLRAAGPVVKACRGSALGGRVGERVSLRLVVEGATGRVLSASALSSHQGTPLGDCVAAAVRDVKFPRFPRARQRVTASVTL